MDLSVQVPQVIDLTTKWELAQRISGHAQAPEQALKSVFTGAMQQLEVVANFKFETSMKDRVWEKVSGDKLKTLKETFILEVCEKILGGFDEKEAKAMLEEHKKNGAVQNTLYCLRLQDAFELKHASVIHAVVQKAHSMTVAWIPAIVDEVRREGVKLPGVVTDKLI